MFITLTSDFAKQSQGVGMMEAIIAEIAPAARLIHYMHGLDDYDTTSAARVLETVRFVIAGAERVKDETRRLWNRSGTIILEGYGATECSPVIACNLPDRNRPGSVYNIVDDQPAQVRDWLPALAELLDAKRPIHVPAWLGRLLAGGHMVVMMTQVLPFYNATSMDVMKRFEHLIYENLLR